MFLLLMACTNGAEKPLSGIKHVFVIGIDGMSSQGLRTAETPNMDYMMANGTVCWSVRTVLPSVSAPNWASMLAGAGTEVHGITSNNWKPDQHTLEPVATSGEHNMFPTVVYVVRKQRPEDKIGMIYHWTGFGILFEKGIASVDINCKTQMETTQALADYIRSEKPTFTFTQLDDVDHAGHEFGHMTEEYLKSIQEVDQCVHLIYQAVKDAGIENESLIMIVSDHGGIGKGHGGNTLEEVTTPVILYGKNVKKNHEIALPVYMYDVAPTIVYALGLKAPSIWRGKAMRSAFCGYEDAEEPFTIKK